MFFSVPHNEISHVIHEFPAGLVQLEANLREPDLFLRGSWWWFAIRIRCMAARWTTGSSIAQPRPPQPPTLPHFASTSAARAKAPAGLTRESEEKDDVIAAIRWLKERYPGLPLALIGYSLGAWVGLQVAHSDPHVAAMVGLGIPLDLYDMEFLIENPKQALYVVGTRDEFCSQENLDRFARRLRASSFVHQIDDADHFFSNQADLVQNLIYDFFSQLHLAPHTL